MVDNTDAYWTNDFETLTLETDTGSTNYVAGIKNVTIEAEYGTLEQLYTADSTKRVDSKQAEFAVPISIEFAFFDPTFVEEWLGGEGSTSTGGQDTSDAQDFTLTGDFRNRDDSKKIEITVEGIVFESIPIFDGSENEFVVWGLEGTGSNISNFAGTTVV